MALGGLSGRGGEPESRRLAPGIMSGRGGGRARGGVGGEGVGGAGGGGGGAGEPAIGARDNERARGRAGEGAIRTSASSSSELKYAASITGDRSEERRVG